MTVAMDFMIENYNTLLVQTVELLSGGEIYDNIIFNQTINCKYSMNSMVSQCVKSPVATCFNYK